jgi:hypothetical protein
MAHEAWTSSSWSGLEGVHAEGPGDSGASTTGEWNTCARLFGAFYRDEDDVEARCLLFASVLIGNNFIAADHGPRSRADVLELALRRLLA